MARTNLTDDDEGKQIVNAMGDEVGIVTEVHGNTAHVDPDPGVTDTIKSKLGWDSADQDDFMVEEDDIARVTDDEIRLRD